MCDCQEPKAASAAAPAGKPVDLTKPVQTRDGKPARILCTDRKRSDLPVVALVTSTDGMEYCECYGADGRYLAGENSDLDLINVPPKVVSEAYLNVYRDGSTGQRHTTKAAAQREASPGALGIIKITTYDDDSFTVEELTP